MQAPRIVRFATLVAAAAAMVWIAGCSESAPSADAEPEASGLSIAEELEARRNAEQAKETAQAAAAAQAEHDALVAEGPSDVSKSDFKKGSKLRGGAFDKSIGGALRAGENLQFENIQRQVDLHAINNGYPKSHEAFMELMQQWRMTLPPLDGPYEYWYNAEINKIQKRPIASADAAEGSASK